MWAPVIWIATLPQRPVGQQMVPMLATNGTSGAVRQPGSSNPSGYAKASMSSVATMPTGLEPC